MKQFRGGLVFKAHRLWYHSTLGSRVIKEKKEEEGGRRTSKPSPVELFLVFCSTTCPQAEGFRFRASSFGFWILGFGLRVSDFGFRISGLVFRVSGFGFEVEDFGVGIPGFGLRVWEALQRSEDTP